MILVIPLPSFADVGGVLVHSRSIPKIRERVHVAEVVRRGVGDEREEIVRLGRVYVAVAFDGKPGVVRGAEFRVDLDVGAEAQ